MPENKVRGINPGDARESAVVSADPQGKATEGKSRASRECDENPDDSKGLVENLIMQVSHLQQQHFKALVSVLKCSGIQKRTENI